MPVPRASRARCEYGPGAERGGVLCRSRARYGAETRPEGQVAGATRILIAEATPGQARERSGQSAPGFHSSGLQLTVRTSRGREAAQPGTGRWRDLELTWASLVTGTDEFKSSVGEGERNFERQSNSVGIRINSV